MPKPGKALRVAVPGLLQVGEEQLAPLIEILRVLIQRFHVVVEPLVETPTIFWNSLCSSTARLCSPKRGSRIAEETAEQAMSASTMVPLSWAINPSYSGVILHSS